MRLGDHLAVSRGPYTHHGILSRPGHVIHYTARSAGSPACIRETDLEAFASGGRVYVVRERSHFSPRGVVRRARSRIGERDYSLVGNNCEHFARWCRVGERRSTQVESVVLRAGRAVVQLVNRYL